MLLTTELDKLSGTDWQLFFAQERAKPYFAELDAFVTAAAAEKTVYPAAENIFAAFRACPVSAVRVVIVGQDPYHEPGQAMGLSFSVPDGSVGTNFSFACWPYAAGARCPGGYGIRPYAVGDDACIGSANTAQPQPP